MKTFQIQIHTLTLVIAAGFASAAVADGGARTEERKYNHAPVTLWIAPQFGTAGLSSDLVKTNVAISLGASAYAKLEGADVGAGASWVTQSMRGAQITAGFNYAGEDAIGAQISAGANIAANELSGVQISSGFNYGSELTGAQIGIVNFGDQVRGGQIGLVNIAGTVRGTQIGLFNFANESRTPLGLFNFIEKGQHHLSLWSSETSPVNLGIKLGGETLYTILTAGVEASNGQKRWLAGIGLGAHFMLQDKFFLETELVASHVNENEAWTTDLNTLSSLRLMVGYEIDDHFSIFGGPTLNLIVSEKGRGEGFGLIEGIRLSDEGADTTVRMWPGLVAGIQI